MNLWSHQDCTVCTVGEKTEATVLIPNLTDLIDRASGRRPVDFRKDQNCGLWLATFVHTATAIPFMYSFSGNCKASVPISKFICLWAIYIFLGSVHIFSCSRIGKPILGIYTSNLLTDTRMWKLGLRPRYSFSGNICFKFSAFCLCSALENPSYRDCSLRTSFPPTTLTKSDRQRYEFLSYYDPCDYTYIRTQYYSMSTFYRASYVCEDVCNWGQIHSPWLGDRVDSSVGLPNAHGKFFAVDSGAGIQ
jgi:hypothetical protein